jgi:alkaline phosphatase
MVPIYAFGPGAERFTGTLQITEIPVRIAELMGIGDFPAAKEGQ